MSHSLCVFITLPLFSSLMSSREKSRSPSASRTAEEQAESLKGALALHIEIFRDLMEDRDTALRKARAASRALVAKEAAREAALDAVVRMLDGRQRRAMARRVLSGWHSYVEKATMLRNMRALSRIGSHDAVGTLTLRPPATPPKTGVSDAEAREAATAAAVPLVDALFSNRPSTLVDTEQLRDSLLGPSRDSSSASSASAGGSSSGIIKAQTNGVAHSEAPAAAAASMAPASTPSGGATGTSSTLAAGIAPPSSPAYANGDWKDREAALLKRLQHLSVENTFMRERTDHLEMSVRSLTAELLDKKSLLHHVYVLHSRALGNVEEPPADGLVAWALPGLSMFLGQDARRREREVADAMEAVLEETLRANMQLQQSVAVLRKQIEQIGHTPRIDAGTSREHSERPGFALRRF